MAFNLNKNNGSGEDSSKKSSSKFDLSKNEAESIPVSEQPSKPKTWIIGLLGILIVGGGIWYFSSGTLPTKNKEIIQSDSASADRTEKQARGTSGVALTDTTIDTRKDSVPEGREEGLKTVTDKQESPVPEKVSVTGAAASVSGSVSTLNNKIPARFAQGSSSLIKIDQSLVKLIKSYLAKNPQASVQINGYASSDGALEINQIISQARADVFKKYLVAENIAENRIIASGKGIENPIASNNHEAGRRKNRRVEIAMINE